MSVPPQDRTSDEQRSLAWPRPRPAEGVQSVRAALADTPSKVVSMREFRLPTRDLVAVADPAGDEPLAGMIGEYGRNLVSDGMLVAWHQQGNEPACLFASGDCKPQSDAERDMLIAARDAAEDKMYQIRWDDRDEEDRERALLTTRIPSSDGVVTITALFQRAGPTIRQKARDAAIGQFITMQAFFRLWIERVRATSSVRGLTAALNSSGVGTMLVDSAGHLLFTNTAAQRLLDGNDGLRRAGKLLSGTRLADTLRLHAAIEHVVNGSDPASVATPVLALHRASGRALMVAIMPVSRQRVGAEGAAVIVRAFDPDQNLEPLLVPVCRLYSLSPVESRLACLLVAGTALAAAARTMRVQEQTARTYLKQIFLKTDTNRQAELVSLMLKCLVTTGPGASTRLI